MHRKKLIGFVAGPLLFVGLIAWPMPQLSQQARLLLGVFAWAVVYWVTEALPVAVTAILTSILAIVLGIAPARSVLAPYADPVIFLFIGSFILAEAIRHSGLDRRVAFAVLRFPWATASPSRLMAAVGAVTWAISLWVSNTATTAMMLPVGLGILRALASGGDAAGHRFSIGLLLMLTWSSSVAVGLPIASPPNLIAIGMIRDLTGRRLTFFDWTAVTMPLAVAMLALAWLVLRIRYVNPRGEVKVGPYDVRPYIEEERRRLGAWSRSEINVAGVFLLTAVLWMLPGAVAMVAGPEAPLPRFLEAHLPESAVALIAVVLLFALPVDLRKGEFTITWQHAARIDWGTILLFGGGLSLGALMFETKLAEVIGRALIAITGANTVWALTAVAIVLGVALSEASSNTASASVIIPTVIAVAETAGISPIPPAIGAALGASFGFMLPVSTPPNAIVYGSGLVPLGEMMRSGVWLDISGVVLIWVGLRILCPLLGVM